MVFTILSDLQRRYRIDLSRIFIIGRGAGGNMAWRSAISYDRFAAVAPAGGGYENYLDDRRLRNLYGSHGYQTWSKANSLGTISTNSLLANWLDGAGYDWERLAFDGPSIEIPSGVIADIATFFAQKVRSPWRRSVYFNSAGSMRYDANWDQHDEQIYLDRAYRWNRRDWLEVTPLANPSTLVDVFATVLDEHTIMVTSSNVRALRIYLHPGMGLDLTKSLEIFANGNVRWSGVVTQSMGALLEGVREWDDPARLYRAYVDITIPNDQTVPEPYGVP